MGSEDQISMEFPGGEGERGSVQMLDMESMDDQKAQDLEDIGRLRQQADLLASRITIRDVSELSSIGKSRHGSEDFSREFKKLSQRPTILSNRTQKRQINEVQHDIERQEQEIALLQKKLQFKTVLENQQVLKPPKRDLAAEQLDVHHVMALGLEKIKKDTEGDCSIF